MLNEQQEYKIGDIIEIPPSMKKGFCGSYSSVENAKYIRITRLTNDETTKAGWCYEILTDKMETKKHCEYCFNANKLNYPIPIRNSQKGTNSQEYQIGDIIKIPKNKCKNCTNFFDFSNREDATYIQLTALEVSGTTQRGWRYVMLNSQKQPIGRSCFVCFNAANLDYPIPINGNEVDITNQTKETKMATIQHGDEVNFTKTPGGYVYIGAVSVNKDGYIYFCCNDEDMNGATADDKLGYKYSWTTSTTKMETVVSYHNVQLINKKISFMTNLTQKVKDLFVKEPEKSFRKAGITNEHDELTSEGAEIFRNWLFQKHAADFKKEIVDALLAAEKEEKKNS